MGNNTPRTTVMKQILSDARALHNGRYFVKRGAINWTTHDFTERPWAIAVFITNSDIGQCAGERDHLTDMQLSFEIATRIPPGDEAEINDETMELLYDDTEQILDKLQSAQDAGSFQVIFKLDRGVANATEFHDPHYRVQGLVVTFSVTF